MSRELVESLRRGYEAFLAGDLDVVVDLLDPGIEFRNPDNAIEPGIRHGPEGFRQALTRVIEAFDYESVEVDELIDRGDVIVIIVHLRGRGKGSGAPIDQRFGHVWRIRDGRAIAFEWFTDPREALEAVKG